MTVYTNPSMSIGINIEKAKDIQRDRWRSMREPLLKALDVKYIQALEQGDTSWQAAIVIEKNELRDVTDTPFPSDLPDDIKNFFPACLTP